MEAQTLCRFHGWNAADLHGTQETLTPISLAAIVARYLEFGSPAEPLETEIIVS